jgi:DNA-binding transcriptional ArsR family regulator
MIQPVQVDAVLHALSDPTRRAVFERVARSELNVSELTRESGVTQGAVSQHLKLLKHVFYRARPEGLAPLFDWLSHYDAFWSERFVDLRILLKEIDP